MPNLQDKLSEPPFPSELNPLTNPVLERNLGRWAQVYFSTPPAKRQQAVGKLLEEIQRETGAGPAQKEVRPYFARDEKFQSALCAACQHQNRPGHKFCSRCGQALHPVQSDPAHHLGETEMSEVQPSRSENDVQWLRDRAFSGLDGSECSAKAGMEISCGRVGACVGRLRVSAVDPETPNRGGANRYRAAVECSGGFSPAKFFFERIQSRRNNFAGRQSTAGPEYRRATQSRSHACRSSAGFSEISTAQCPSAAAGAGRRGQRRLRSAPRPALSRRKHGRPGFL